MKLTPKARAVLAERRWENRQWALHSRHVREVAWFGSDGERCYGCMDVPIHRWEQFTLDQAEHLAAMRASRFVHSDVWNYVQYLGALRHEMRRR